MQDKNVITIKTEISCDSIKCLLEMADGSLPFLDRDTDPEEVNFLINKALTLQAQQATEAESCAFFRLDGPDADYLDGLVLKKDKKKDRKKYLKRMAKAVNRLLDAERGRHEWYNRPAEEENKEAEETSVAESGKEPAAEPEEELFFPEPGVGGFSIHVHVSLTPEAADALAAQEEAGLSRKEAIEEAVFFLSGEHRKGPDGWRKTYFCPGISAENMAFLRERAAGGHGNSAVLSAAIRRERPRTEEEKKLDEKFAEWLKWH